MIRKLIALAGLLAILAAAPLIFSGNGKGPATAVIGLAMLGAAYLAPVLPSVTITGNSRLLHRVPVEWWCLAAFWLTLLGAALYEQVHP